MMKHPMMPIAAAAGLAACHPADRNAPLSVGHAARSCAPVATSIADIGVTVRGLFTALARDDDATVARLTVPTFYAFEGERMTAPQLSAVIRRAHEGGQTYIWNIGPIDAHVDCNVAWASWENVGASGIAPALQPRRWLESAVLVHDGLRWRMRFMHSTPVNRPK